MSSKEFDCLSVQGHTTTLKNHVVELGFKSLMIDRAETMMHARFGDLEYWTARRSMRFAKRLTKVSDEFRAEHLDSNDKKDNTVKTIKWENFIVSSSNAYIIVTFLLQLVPIISGRSNL